MDSVDGESGVPRAGELLAGKYRIEETLGKGAMGVVVAARHIDLGKRVAIKFLGQKMSRHPEAIVRFLREARAVARLQSEHVARVHDVGRMDNGSPFMVMEILSGETLTDLLRARGRLSIAEAIDYVLQACEAIAEAHAQGIVHRDLKPANLFLTRGVDGSPLVKVLDFGISKVINRLDSLSGRCDLTEARALLGSPLYMSPEQIRCARNIDGRTDLWSLGVILYELIAGIRPFEAESSSACLAKVVADPPTPLRALRPELPDELEAVILRCLEKNTQHRYQSVTELARALSDFAEPRSRFSLVRIEGVEREAERDGPKSSMLAMPSRTLPGISPAMVPESGADTVRLPADAGVPERERAISNGASAESAAESASPSTRRAVSSSRILSRWSIVVDTLSSATSPASKLAARTIGRALLIIASVAAAIAAFFMTLRLRSEARLPEDASTRNSLSTQEAPRVLSSPVPASPPQRVKLPSIIALRLYLDPPHATVSLDGVEVKGPQIHLPRASRTHRLVVSAPGYETVTREILAADDAELSFSLVRRAPLPTPAPVRKEPLPEPRLARDGFFAKPKSAPRGELPLPAKREPAEIMNASPYDDIPMNGGEGEATPTPRKDVEDPYP